MTIFGWDASDYDWGRGPMDLGSARSAGISFFTHKATEGTSVQHGHFGEAMRRAESAGIPILGAYHVVRSPRNARAEVDYFLRFLDQQWPRWRTHPAFFIQVDLEKWPYDEVPAVEGEEFADISEALSGKVALIYASKGQYGNSLAGTSHELWNANYPLSYRTGDFRTLYNQSGGDLGPGWVYYSGRTPRVWQYSSSAVIGRQPTCDANAFRGSESDFRAMIRATPVTKMVSPREGKEMFDKLSATNKATGGSSPAVGGPGNSAFLRLASFWGPSKVVIDIRGGGLPEALHFEETINDGFGFTQKVLPDGAVFSVVWVSGREDATFCTVETVRNVS